MARQTFYIRGLLMTAATSLFVAACGSDNNDDNGLGEVASGTSFTDVSAQIASYQRGPGEGYGGLGWVDYDNDNDLDLMLTNEQGFNNAFFENNGDGTFSDVTSATNTLITTGNSGVVVGDIDNDGCADIFMSGTGFFVGPVQSATVLLHNQCDGTFVDISSSANVPGAETALSAAFGDINNDGFVDLFVTAQGHLPFGTGFTEQHRDKLYLNNGDLTFTDISAASGTDGGLGSCVATFSHFDDDEYIDLFVGVCNDVTFAPTPWHVYRNNGDNTFTDVAPTTQLDFGGYWMTSTFGDIDNDGDFDIFSTNLGFAQRHVLWRNNGDGSYVEIFEAATDEIERGDGNCGTQEETQFEHCWAWGGTFADFDNDYFQDLYFAGELPGVRGALGQGNPGYLFFNNGNTRFRLAEPGQLDLNLTGKGATGLAKADFDNDGFVDFVVMTSSDATPVAPVLMRNNGNGNTSLTVKLEGSCRSDGTSPSPCSNRMAIGGRVEIVTPNGVFQAREIWAGSSFVSNESPWPVFGLGREQRADATVYWPSGLVESFPNLAAGQLHELAEGTGTAL
jgi:hypothetical protein